MRENRLAAAAPPRAPWGVYSAPSDPIAGGACPLSKNPTPALGPVGRGLRPASVKKNPGYGPTTNTTTYYYYYYYFRFWFNWRSL